MQEVRNDSCLPWPSWALTLINNTCIFWGDDGAFRQRPHSTSVATFDKRIVHRIT